MKFYMPTRLFSAPDCVKNHAQDLAALGTRALIVTGRSSRKNHSLDDVTAALQSQGIAFAVFDRTEENPSVETVMAACGCGLAAGADFVIGIGGGSPMDAAKAAAVMMKHPDADWTLLYENTPADALPVAAVPTTCGTGSEVTGVAVLTRHDLGTKVSMTHKIFPRIALIDGKYLLSAPHRILVNTAIDALSHLIESCIHSQADTFSDMTAFAGLSLWRQCRTYLESDAPLTLDAAQALMNAASLAGMAIAQNGTTIPHALSYLLTAQAGIPHGAAVGAFQANYLALADPARRQAVLQAAGFESTGQLGRWIAKQAPVSVERSLLERSAEAVLHNPAKLRLCPYPIDEHILAQIIAIGTDNGSI